MTHWCKVAPIYDLDIEELRERPFDFGRGLLLCRMPDWIRQDQFLENLSYIQRKNLERNATLALVAEFRADRLEDPDPEWRGEPSHVGVRKYQLMVLANLAMWLSKPSLACFGCVIDAKRGSTQQEWSCSRTMEVAPSLIAPHEEGNRVSLAELELARKLFLALSDLQQYTTLWTAMNMAWLAITVHAAPLRYLTFWVSLESLFGAKEPGEITFKLSQRMALFLCEKRNEGLPLSKLVKERYHDRSKIAHGSFRDSKKISLSLGDTENLVRKSLIKILMDQELVKIFNSDKERDNYLSTLPYA